MTDLLTPHPTDQGREREPTALVPRLIGRISRIEVAVAAVIAAVMLLLVVLEPDILEAPFENANTIVFTVGGTVVAGLALVAMLWFRVPPAVRVIVLVVPFAIVNWWLLSPYFIDDVVDEEFATSISAQAGLGAAAAGSSDAGSGRSSESAPAGSDVEPGTRAAPGTAAEGASDSTDPSGTDPADPDAPADQATDETAAASPDAGESDPSEAETAAEAAPTGPVLLGAGQFVGLAGHHGTGDAGLFRNPDGSLVLRFENFDIQNGPDLEVYLVPGADRTSLAEGSIHLGALKGNVGDQNYDFASGTDLPPGVYTALVWCEAFSVEFVGATISV